MRTLLSIACASAWHRRFVLSLVVATVALSTFLLLAVERLREDVRSHFAQSVSGTDLIVGPRTGATQLLLYSVFRIGHATQNIRWRSVQALAADARVAWAIPLALGDAHRGFPVVGTTDDYFEHFRYGESRPLVLAHGGRFDGVFDAVIGAEVADRLRYRVGQKIVLAHGAGELTSDAHADHPFTVVGILARTGTPVDRSVHVRLEGMEAMHSGMEIGLATQPGAQDHGSGHAGHDHGHEHQDHGREPDAQAAARTDPAPKEVTAVLLGLKSRAAVFALQRHVAEFAAEPLLAILPGVALAALWQTVGAGEAALALLAALIALVSLAGLVAVVLAGLEQRRGELAVLRSVGAGPRAVFALLLLEGLLATLAGALLGTVACIASIALAGPWIERLASVPLSGFGPAGLPWGVLAAVLAVGAAASALPGWRAYRLTLADGLRQRG